MTDPEGLHQYDYDNTYQLTGADYPAKPDQNYVYDPAGNREAVVEGGAPAAYTTDNMNRYTAVNTTTYGYDNNGCLTSKTDTSETTTYQYDYENRLTKASSLRASASGGSTSEATEAIYTYDYLGRRVTTNNNGTITYYIYDGNRVIAEYDDSGSLVCEYIYGNSIDEILYMLKGADVYYYHYDGLSSVRAIADDTGATIETYAYDVHGKPATYDASGTKITESQIGNRNYFTGREFDKETGLYYYRARYYDPELGRFISPDPAGPVDGPNLYTYCGNDSVNWTDPLGLMSGKERNDWLKEKLKKKDEKKKKTSSIGQQIKDFILPSAEAYRDYDEMLDEMDRRARKGEEQRAGDIALTKEEVQEAVQKVNKLKSELLKSIWKGWKKWFKW